MRVWLVALMFVSLSLTGCMEDAAPLPGDRRVKASDEEGVDDRDPTPPQAEEETEANDTGEAPTARRSELPPGGLRRDEVWRDVYHCPPGVACPVQDHGFEVAKRFAALTVTLTIDAPGAVCCNSLAVWLTAPNGLKVPGADLPYLSTYTGGEAVSFAVEDPEVLDMSGRWVLSVGTVDLAATVVAYEARVTFVPHPEHPAVTADPPERVSLEATHYMGADFPIEWDRVDRILPDGFAPLGFPYFRLLDAHRGLPPGTLASLLVLGMHYEGGTIDDTTLPAGDLVLALALVDPPEEHEHPQQEYLWFGAVASDALLADALTRLAVPTAAGEVQIGMEATGPLRTGTVEVSGGPLDLRMEVQVEQVMPLLGSPNREQEMVHFSATAGEVDETLVWTLGEHQSFPGDVALDGLVSHLGAVDGHGLGGILWFGSADAPSDETGTWQYERVPPDAGTA